MDDFEATLTGGHPQFLRRRGAIPPTQALLSRRTFIVEGPRRIAEVKPDPRVRANVGDPMPRTGVPVIMRHPSMTTCQISKLVPGRCGDRAS